MNAVLPNPLRRVVDWTAGMIGVMIGAAIFTWFVVTRWILPTMAAVSRQGSYSYRVTQEDVRTRLGVPVRPQAGRPWGGILLVLVILVVAAAIVVLVNWPQILAWFWSVERIDLFSFGQISVDPFCGGYRPCG